MLMLGFVFLTMFSFIFEIALLAPAIMLFLLQFVVMRGEFRRDYPEDWTKYSMLFIGYEAVLVVLFYAMLASAFSLSNFSSIVNIFIFIIVIIVSTVIVKLFIGRRRCYGTVLFATKDWVGVHIKSDLFSKINEADYAVRNPSGIKFKKGDRVEVLVKGSLGKGTPAEVLKKSR
jgi:uncharacterized membrane protein